MPDTTCSGSKTPRSQTWEDAPRSLSPQNLSNIPQNRRPLTGLLCSASRSSSSSHSARTQEDWFFEDFHFWRWRSPCGVVGDLCCQDLNQTSRQKQAPGVLLCEHPHNNRTFAKPRPQNPSDWGEHQRSGEYKITNIDYKYIYKWVVTRKIFWWHGTLNWMHELCPKSIFFSSWLGNFPRYSFEFFTRGQCLNPEQRDKRPGSMWIDLRSRSTQYENFIDNLL